VRLLTSSSDRLPTSATVRVVMRPRLLRLLSGRSCRCPARNASDSVVSEGEYDGIACLHASDVRMSPYPNREAHVTGSRALRNFVNGAWSDAADGATFDLVDPSTGEVFATSPRSGAADVDAAVVAATAAFETWRDTTPSERQRALLRIADAIESRGKELVDAECQNTGKPVQLTLDEELPPALD